MNWPLLVDLIAIPVVAGASGTWLWARHKERVNVASRLSELNIAASTELVPPPATLLKKNDWLASHFNIDLLSGLPGFQNLKQLVSDSIPQEKLPDFAAIVLTLLFCPLFIAAFKGCDISIGFVAGIILSPLPFLFLKIRMNAQRAKFSEQLPDAVDLMVAVLRSGHSVAQAVQAVANEIANPCGQEFASVLHRLDLGQPLTEALTISARHFHSYELDLMRRAVAIQAEVGGSLAELLDKTNNTLRERLKLARQLKVVTAQSRLSAYIVGMLPIVLAFVLNFLNPGYLQTLVQDQVGRILLFAAIGLEIAGIVIMQRMSTMKV